jgi:pimeloyl-ACP methyl ester carboxylesterase
MYEVSSSHHFKYISTNGIRLHSLIAGNPQNTMLILLHGFPEFHLGWANQVDRFVKSGYFVVVPDQRGYNLSDKPNGLESYLVKELAADILGIMTHLSKEKAYLAGHDWGGSVGYYLAMNFPERFYKLIAINTCIQETLLKLFYKSHKQRWRSLHMFWFNLSQFTKWYLSRNNYEAMSVKFLKKSKKGTFSSSMITEYKKAWTQNGAIQSMTNWYRASFSRKNKGWSKPITIPLLIIWGKQDYFLSNTLAEASAKYANDVQIKYIENGTHWVIHEYPDDVGQLILEFIAE